MGKSSGGDLPQGGGKSEDSPSSLQDPLCVLFP